MTAVDHISFRFSQTAESLGMPVIDDPQSIVRCSNKIYLHELCERHGIPMLPAMIVSRKTPAEELHALGFPVVLKAPDGSFSAAVRRAETPAGLDLLLAAMLAKSPLLLAQPFSPTDFDWRIGVLEGRLLYACKYHVARGHWQIAQYDGKGGSRSGRVEGVAIVKVPVRVREIAPESSALMIPRGEVLTGEMLAYKRTDERFEPGFPPREAHRVIGRRARRPIQADETLREDMLE